MQLSFYLDSADEHRWSVWGDNGEPVGASSESFSSKAKAEHNFRLVTSRDPKTGRLLESLTAAAVDEATAWTVV